MEYIWFLDETSYRQLPSTVNLPVVRYYQMLGPANFEQ